MGSGVKLVPELDAGSRWRRPVASEKCKERLLKRLPPDEMVSSPQPPLRFAWGYHCKRWNNKEAKGLERRNTHTTGGLLLGETAELVSTGTSLSLLCFRLNNDMTGGWVYVGVS
jgi:hypothetical protein